MRLDQVWSAMSFEDSPEPEDAAFMGSASGITSPMEHICSDELLEAPILVLKCGGGPKRSERWRKLLGKMCPQVFYAGSLQEAMVVLGECEKLGTPVGLAILDGDMARSGAKSIAEILHCCREWRGEAEFPIFYVDGVAAAGGIEGPTRMEVARLGASEFFEAPLDEPYFLLRSEQKLRASERAWRLQYDKRHAEELLQQHKSSNITQDLWRLDLASRTLEFNENCRELSGYSPHEIGTSLDSWLNLVHPKDLARLTTILAGTDWSAAVEDLSFEFRLKHRSGAWRWLFMRGRLERDELGLPVGLMGAHTDITNAKTLDSVTGLPNRYLFDEWLQQQTCAEVDLGIFLVGLDRFSVIRDSLGHEMGDRLLRIVGERMNGLLENGPGFGSGARLAARISEDEFGIALCGVHEMVEARGIADGIEECLSKGIWIDGREIFVSTSVGFAARRSHPHIAIDGKELLQNAEIALHNAKAAGGARIIAFDGKMRAKVIERMELENELKRAIEQWEFEIYYQPKVTMTQERIIGFEALIRWRHPVKGIIPPSQFIPLAEENGLIIPLGIRTVREACTTIRKWQLAFPQDPPLEVSVNLSVRQFQDSHLLDEIRQILADTGTPPSTLQFEVTESVLVDDPDQALAIVEELRRMGVGLKIDDFGTGYSSLSYLHRLPFDCLKIDRSFISTMGQDHTAYEIVRAIISLAQSLGLQVVAEGVENRGQAEELRNMGCDYGQGYLYAPPLTGDAAQRMLESQALETRGRGPVIDMGPVAEFGTVPLGLLENCA